MKWLVLLALVCVLVPTQVGADLSDHADITITATGIAVAPPSGFTAYYLSDYEILLEWVPATSANATMVRVAYGRQVDDREDGVLVYHGSGNSTIFWTPNIGITAPLYFRAWSQTDTGWDEVGADEEADFMSTSFFFILLAALSLGLTLGFFWKQSAFLAYGAAGTWALVGFQSLQASSSTSPVAITDTYMGLFWLCIVFVIGCMLLPLIMREKPVKEDIYIDEVTGDPIQKEERERKRRPRKSRFAQHG